MDPKHTLPAESPERSAPKIPPSESAGPVTDPGELVDLTDRQLAVVFDTSHDALALVDDQRRYLMANEPCAVMLGAPVEAILARRIDDFTPPELVPLLERLWDRFSQQGRIQGRYLVQRGDGGRVVIEYRGSRQLRANQHIIAARYPADGAPPPAGRLAADVPPLTPRELEVLQLAADGGSVQQMAEALVVSPMTVKTHLQNIYEKLETHDRATAVARGLRLGLIS